MLEGRPGLAPGSYIRMAISGPGDGVIRCQAMLRRIRTDGLEVELLRSGAPQAIAIGTPVDCSVDQTDHALLWSATVVRMAGPGWGHLVISYPERYTRTRLRQGARVAVSLPVAFRGAGADRTLPVPEGTGYTVDLARDGLSLATPSALAPGQELHLTLQLEHDHDIVCNARVIRAMRPAGGNMPACYALKITAISEADRAAIIRRILDEQDRQKRQGMLAGGEWKT